MKHRIVRLALVVLAVAGQAAAGFFVFELEQGQAAARVRLAALTRQAAAVHSIVGELRVAQAGMVAQGQDPGFWVPKVATLLDKAAAGLRDMDPALLSTEAAQDRAAAAEAIAAFGRTTDRVRDRLANDQPLTASALAFGDAAEQLSTATAALSSLPTTQRLANERDVSRARRNEVYALLGAAGFTTLALLLLLPRMRLATESEDGATAAGLGLSLRGPSAAEGDPLGRRGLDVDIRRPAGTQAEPLPEQPHESEVEIVNDLQQESQLRLNTEAQVDLAETARLCGDLARVKDGGELPAILARAADVLDAAGIVLWIAEAEGTSLRPAASHGYSEHTMAKMKALSVSAENAVSLAYRGGRMEVVPGTKDRNGALVSPINAAAGCVGAMAIEIRHGAEASPAVQAVAAIISAQLATLVAETTSA